MKKGFSLIEIMVVMGVIAVLISLGILGTIMLLRSNRDSLRVSKLSEIAQAINSYKLEKSKYPAKNNVVFGSTELKISFKTSENLIHASLLPNDILAVVNPGSSTVIELPGHLASGRETTSNSTKYYYNLETGGFSLCAVLESGKVENAGLVNCPPSF